MQLSPMRTITYSTRLPRGTTRSWGSSLLWLLQRVYETSNEHWGLRIWHITITDKPASHHFCCSNYRSIHFSRCLQSFPKFSDQTWWFGLFVQAWNHRSGACKSPYSPFSAFTISAHSRIDTYLELGKPFAKLRRIF